MPTYRFLDKNTKDEYEIFMSISERDAYIEQNPHVEQLVNGFPGTVDPTRIGRTKVDSGFKDVLKEIKGKFRGSTINTW